MLSWNDFNTHYRAADKSIFVCGCEHDKQMIRFHPLIVYSSHRVQQLMSQQRECCTHLSLSLPVRSHIIPHRPSGHSLGSHTMNNSLSQCAIFSLGVNSPGAGKSSSTALFFLCAPFCSAPQKSNTLDTAAW